jgi:hypothetical protein
VAAIDLPDNLGKLTYQEDGSIGWQGHGGAGGQGPCAQLEEAVPGRALRTIVAPAAPFQPVQFTEKPAADNAGGPDSAGSAVALVPVSETAHVQFQVDPAALRLSTFPGVAQDGAATVVHVRPASEPGEQPADHAGSQLVQRQVQLDAEGTCVQWTEDGATSTLMADDSLQHRQASGRMWSLRGRELSVLERGDDRGLAAATIPLAAAAPPPARSIPPGGFGYAAPSPASQLASPRSRLAAARVQDRAINPPAVPAARVRDVVS